MTDWKIGVKLSLSTCLGKQHNVGSDPVQAVGLALVCTEEGYQAAEVEWSDILYHVYMNLWYFTLLVTAEPYLQRRLNSNNNTQKDRWSDPWLTSQRSFLHVRFGLHLPKSHEKCGGKWLVSNIAKGLMFSIGHLISADCIWANWYLNCKLKWFVQRPLWEDCDYNILLILLWFRCPGQK